MQDFSPTMPTAQIKLEKGKWKKGLWSFFLLSYYKASAEVNKPMSMFFSLDLYADTQVREWNVLQVI